MNFTTLKTKESVNLINYVANYLTLNPETEILVGCDSQNNTNKTLYATVVALYKPKKGALILYNKETTNIEKTRQVRLMNEVWKSVEVAEFMKNAGLPQVKFIDIDINPNPKFKSNEVLRSAVGLVEGMGYTVRYKSMGVAATYAADMLVK